MSTTEPPGFDDSIVFRSLFAAYPDALLLVDPKGVVVLAKPAALTLLGYSRHELLGMTVEALVPESVRHRHAAYREAYARSPRTRPMGTQMDLVARRRDGSEIMVEIALSPLTEHDLPYVVAAIRGIGDYPRVRQALQRARYAEQVAQMGRGAVDARDPRLLLEQVPKAAVEALQADMCVAFLLGPSRLAFRVAGGVSLLPGEAAGQTVANRSDTPPGFVVAEGKPVIVEDYASERRFDVPPATV